MRQRWVDVAAVVVVVEMLLVVVVTVAAARTGSDAAVVTDVDGEKVSVWFGVGEKGVGGCMVWVEVCSAAEISRSLEAYRGGSFSPGSEMRSSTSTSEGLTGNGRTGLRTTASTPCG